MADGRIDPFDVAALERSVNDSAGRVSSIWLSFVAFSAYLAAAASMISHRQIFLEEPIKLPTINIDLPLVASAIVLPLLFVIYHVFVLLQVVLLARTADAYNDAIDHGVADEADRIRVRQRLANTLFAQLFAGSSREREGVLGWLLHAMAWITLAIAPVGVLIIFEIKFLPYHSAAVTWTHRGLIAFDLLAVLMLWAGAVEARRDIVWRSLGAHRRMAIGAAAMFVLSNVLITFPGEPGRMWMSFIGPSNQSSSDPPECQIPWTVEVILSPSFDRLVLLGEDFVDDTKLNKLIETATTNKQTLYDAERTRIFRGRDLRCAHLAGTDLRLVDFAESDLSGAILRGAHLEGATFAGATLARATLDNAQLQGSSFAAREIVEKQLPEAQLPRSSLRGAQLQGANLKGANLEGADLQQAQLEKSILREANLRGATFRSAKLANARLDGAKLQGALFQSAEMQNTSLASAQMQGASLNGAKMLGASLDSAIMHGASFYKTKLHGAQFFNSQLQGAVFREAEFEGTIFLEAQMQGVQMEEQTEFRDTIVSSSFLWHAGNVSCNLTHVAEPNFDAIIEVRDEQGNSPLVPANDQEIAAFIERSLQGVPDKSKFVPAFSKNKLRDNLKKRLQSAASVASETTERAWKACATQSEARTLEDSEKIAKNIAKYACNYSDDYFDINSFVRAFTGSPPGDDMESPGSLWPRLLNAIPVGWQFAELLLAGDDQQCANVKSLNKDAIELLQYVVNPGE